MNEERRDVRWERWEGWEEWDGMGWDDVDSI
jgi:hypothetical protein